MRLRSEPPHAMLGAGEESEMRWMFLAAAIAAGGCQTTAPRDPGPAPKDAKGVVREHIRTTFNDPYSLRDVEIGDAEPSQIAGGWLVCFRANGKNRMGAYIGLSTIVYQIKNDKVIDSEQGDGAERFCALRRMAPWKVDL
jgi:hypothetical protein